MKGAEAAVQAGRRLAGALEKYKFVLLVLLAGVLLLVLPLPGGGEAEEGRGAPVEAGVDFDLEGLERRMEAALSQVEGAGEVSVGLTLRSGTRQVLAQDVSSARGQEEQSEERTTVVVSSGSGREEAVALQQVYPQFQGALVVCTGGEDPAVQLKMVEAVSALTGLGSDKISICKGK